MPGNISVLAVDMNLINLTSDDKSRRKNRSDREIDRRSNGRGSENYLGSEKSNFRLSGS